MNEKDTSRKAKLLIVAVFVIAAVFVGVNYVRNIPTEASASGGDRNASAHISSDSIVALYYRTTCPFCHEAMDFIDSTLQDEFPTIRIAKVNVANLKGAEKAEFDNFSQKNNLRAVPVFRVGNDFAVGFRLSESAPIYRNMLQKKLDAQPQYATY